MYIKQVGLLRVNVLKNTMSWLFLLTLLMLSATSMAGAKLVPIDGIGYTINASMMDNLNRLTGKKISITIDGGKVLTGKVKSVGQHLLHLEKIERKEFFDALIRIDRIQAIEVQFRKYKR